MDPGDVGSRVRGICMNNVACNISPRAFLYNNNGKFQKNNGKLGEKRVRTSEFIRARVRSNFERNFVS